MDQKHRDCNTCATTAGNQGETSVSNPTCFLGLESVLPYPAAALPYLNVASGKPVHTAQHSGALHQTTNRLSSQALDSAMSLLGIWKENLSPQGHLAVPDICATIIRAIVGL
jgi:hypothetical protein